MEEYFVAWWNLENLFDLQNAPKARRGERLAKKLKSELKDWTKSVLDKKIDQLVKIISQLNNGTGPDILGFCEVENSHVVNLLSKALKSALGRTFRTALLDSEDPRGIDVGFLLDEAKFGFDPAKMWKREIVKRSPTRDLFQVNVTTTAGNNPLVLIANHWPSRMSGELDTEPYRVLAGETLAYWHQRIREELGPDIAIIAMGDFNDEPFDRSLRDYARALRSPKKVSNARTPCFLNLMWPLLGQGRFSYFSEGPNMLDQFLVSKALLGRSGKFRLKSGSEGPGQVAVFQAPEMASGSYGRPKRFGRPSKPSSHDLQGFSDHFPITMVIEEA